eukprot:gene24625-10247_t
MHCLAAQPSQYLSRSSAKCSPSYRVCDSGLYPLKATVSSAVAVRAEPISRSSSTVFHDDSKAKWFMKPSAFLDVNDSNRLEAAVKLGRHDGKWTVVEFYASWCTSCRSSFPGLCKIPHKENMSESFNFFKASLEDRGIHRYVRKLGVEGIPVVCIFNPSGQYVLSLNANFTNLPKIKASLAVIALHKGCSKFVLGSDGVVIPFIEEPTVSGPAAETQLAHDDSANEPFVPSSVKGGLAPEAAPIKLAQAGPSLDL